MTHIAFVRHGETEWNRELRIQGLSDIPLNDTGREQARRAGYFLESLELPADAVDGDVPGAAFVTDSRADEAGTHPWTHLMTSPLIRARETGAIIADHLGGLAVLPPEPGVRERDYGHVEGRDIERANAAYPDHAYPLAEQPGAVVQRGVQALERLTLALPDAHVVVVAHGGLIVSVLRHLTGDATLPSVQNASVSLLRARARAGSAGTGSGSGSGSGPAAHAAALTWDLSLFNGVSDPAAEDASPDYPAGHGRPHG